MSVGRSRSATASSSTAPAPSRVRRRRRSRDGRDRARSARCPRRATEIDAAGKVVAPGFIDIHSHSDYTLLVDPRAASADPSGRDARGRRQLRLRLLPAPRQGARAEGDLRPLGRRCRSRWTTAAGYFERLEEAAPGDQRAQPRAERADPARRRRPRGPARAPGRAERDALPARRGARAGRLGLLDRARVRGRAGRRRGRARLDVRGLRPPRTASTRRTRDAATRARTRRSRRRCARRERSGVRLQVSHLVPRNGHRVGAPLHRARRRCRRRRAGRRLRHAHAALRHDVPAHGAAAVGARGSGTAARDPRKRERSDARCASYESILSAGGDWSRIVLLDNDDRGPTTRGATSPRSPPSADQDPLDAVYDLLLGAADDPGSLMVIIHAYTEEQQREAFAHPLCVPGSDATTMAPDGPLAGQVFHGAYTWAAWYLRFCVQQEQVLSLPEAIRRLTGQPAERLGLPDRGVLRAGRARRRRRLRPARHSARKARRSTRAGSRRGWTRWSSTASSPSAAARSRARATAPSFGAAKPLALDPGARARGRAPRPRPASPSRCRRASSSRARRGRRRTRRRDRGRRARAARRSGPRRSCRRRRRGRGSRDPVAGSPRRSPVSRDQAIADQSLTVALRTVRSVVATTAKFGNSAAARSIIARNEPRVEVGAGSRRRPRPRGRGRR